MPRKIGAVARQIENINQLSNLKFAFRIERFPEVNYFVQRANLPSVSIQSVSQPNPFIPIPQQGDRMNYEPLSISFVVDEYLKNWISIYRWMEGITFPQNFEQFKDIRFSNTTINPDTGNLFSDITLSILTNKSNPKLNIFFKNAFPISLSSINFDTTEVSVESVICEVSFIYNYFDIEIVSEI
jgi:hypothetical protein